MTTPLRRTARALGAIALSGSLLVSCGTSHENDESARDSGAGAGAESAAPTQQATSAADWLAGQLDGGLLSYTSEYGPFTDLGMSIDAAVSLAQVGGHDEDVAAIATGVEKGLDSYVEFPSGKGTHVSAGAVAKAAVLAEVAGQEPSDGGRDRRRAGGARR